MISCRSQGGRTPSYISHDPSSMRFTLLLLLLAVHCHRRFFVPVPDRLASPKMSLVRLFKPDPCSLSPAFLDALGLQAYGIDTTGATVGDWYLRVGGSRLPAARFRCAGPSLGIAGRASGNPL